MQICNFCLVFKLNCLLLFPTAFGFSVCVKSLAIYAVTKSAYSQQLRDHAFFVKDDGFEPWTALPQWSGVLHISTIQDVNVSTWLFISSSRSLFLPFFKSSISLSSYLNGGGMSGANQHVVSHCLANTALVSTTHWLCSLSLAGLV